MSSIASIAAARSFPVPYQPLPIRVPEADPCDISGLLSAQRHDDLDKALNEAFDNTFVDREGETFYTDRLENFDRALHREGGPSLAQIRAWQAASPGSGHAHLLEAHYWFHWSYVYRGGGWASTVTNEGWVCAHAAIANMCVAALRALALDPRLWAAPVIMMHGVAAFGEPDWLTALVLTGRSRLTSVGYSLPEADEATRQQWTAMLARAGMAPDDRLQLPDQRPAALPAPVNGKKRSKSHHYWMEAALHIHPRLFLFLRQYIWFLQPRWGGSHDRIRSFVASAHCAHLDAVEKDRLLHEIWRDDHLNSFVDKATDPADAEQAIQATRRRAAEALHFYHRYETLAWLARSLNMLDRETEALECLKRAEAEYPIDDEIVMYCAQYLALKYEPESTWLAQAVCRSAEGGYTDSAQILYGYFALRGMQGFACDPAIGRAWLESGHRDAPKAMHFREIAQHFRMIGMFREAFDICQAGYDLGAPKSAQILGDMYEAGQHVEPDALKALQYYQEEMDKGDSYSALMVGWLHNELARSASNDEELAHHERGAITATLRAHEMDDNRALDKTFRYIAKATLIRIRHEHKDWVKRHADEGHPLAMAAWAGMLGTYEDKELYNQRESVRWLMGAQAIAPDDAYVQETEAFLRGTGWVSRFLYGLTRKRIRAHEIPGADNAMV